MTNITYQPGSINASAAFGSAWEQVKSNYGIYLGISLLTIVLIACLSCFGWFLMGPLMGGVFYVAMRGYRGEPVEFGMMFEGFKKYRTLMTIGLFQSLPTILLNVVYVGIQLRYGPDWVNSVGDESNTLLLIIACAYGLFFLATMIIWVTTYFAIPVAMEYNIGAGEALSTSVKAVFANFGGMIAVFLFSCLVALIGLMILCLGVYFISLPVIFVANAIVYCQVFPRRDAQPGYFAPPPPGTYGFGNPQY